MMVAGACSGRDESLCGRLRLKQIDGRRLVAEAGAYGDTLAADGATTAQHGCAGLGLHARTKTVRLDAFAAIGLKCALGHENALLFPLTNLRLDGKFQVYRRLRPESSLLCLAVQKRLRQPASHYLFQTDTMNDPMHWFFFAPP
jgi:hypothetical protein